MKVKDADGYWLPPALPNSREERIESAARAVLPYLIDFSERKQLLRCRVCGSEPELGDYGRLHKPGCVVYDLQEALE